MGVTSGTQRRINKRRRHLEEQSGKCYYCKFPAFNSQQRAARFLREHSNATKEAIQAYHGQMVATLEHLTTKSQHNAPYDTVAACNMCNHMRDRVPVVDFIRYVDFLLRNQAHPHQIFLLTGTPVKMLKHPIKISSAEDYECLLSNPPHPKALLYLPLSRAVQDQEKPIPHCCSPEGLSETKAKSL